MDCGPGSLTQLHSYIEQLANFLELMGVSIIVLGVAVATGIFLRDGIRRQEWRDGYDRYPANLGRARRNSKGCSLTPFLAKTFHPQLAQSFDLSLPFSLRLTCPPSSNWPWLSKPTSLVRPLLPSLGLVS